MNFFNQLKTNFQNQGSLTKIIIINISVFLVVNIVGNLSHLSLLSYFALPIGGIEFIFKFWTLFTYMFTHEGLGHLFWNMILFYFMAQVFYTIMGEKKLIYVYVMSGLSGGAIVLTLGLLFPTSFANSILIGASAAVLGVGAVMAVYSPNYRIYLFGMIEMSYKYFYLLTFALSTIIDLSINTGGKISHIGGALFGLLYAYYLKKGTDLFQFSFGLKRRNKLKIVSYQNEKDVLKRTASSDESRMNHLLDKISKGGYDSLTKVEKDELFKLSQKK